MSAKIAVGGKAPGFKLPRDGGGEVSLADFKGASSSSISIPRPTPRAVPSKPRTSPGWRPAFARAGTAILGVSADPVTKQDKFKAKHDLSVGWPRTNPSRC